MLIKTVTTVVTTDSTGKPVDAIPVRNATTGETDAAGRPVTPISVTEDPLGIPVRVVTGKSAQNSAGQWIDSIPIQGGGGYPGYSRTTINGVPVEYKGAALYDNAPATPLSVRT